jgi:hypothetical protein
MEPHRGCHAYGGGARLKIVASLEFRVGVLFEV